LSSFPVGDVAEAGTALAVAGLRKELDVKEILAVTTLPIACGWPCPAALVLDHLDTAYVLKFDTTVLNVNNGPFAGSGLQSGAVPGQLAVGA
jgi:hypothetical protein